MHNLVKKLAISTGAGVVASTIEGGSKRETGQNPTTLQVALVAAAAIAATYASAFLERKLNVKR